jgi:hypothetical protein
MLRPASRASIVLGETPRTCENVLWLRVSDVWIFRILEAPKWGSSVIVIL